MKILKITPYDPNWPKFFELESKKIKLLLGDACINIHHIGSTSVENLAAKNEIDILLVMDDLQNSLLLQENGYIFKGEYNIPLRYFFSKNIEKYNINLHVCEANHSFIKLNLSFRDYLRKNKKSCEDYEILKYKIFESPDASLKTNGGFSNYNKSKDIFIKSALRKLDYSDLNITFAMHNKEWEYVRKVCEEYSKDHNILNKDVINNRDHRHFILYKGPDIIGYSHIELFKESRSVIHRLVINENNLQKKYIEEFRFFIKKWLKFNDYSCILAELKN